MEYFNLGVAIFCAASRSLAYGINNHASDSFCELREILEDEDNEEK